MAISWQQIVIIGVIVLILFGGKGMISGFMGDIGRGLRAFRLGLASDDESNLPRKGE